MDLQTLQSAQRLRMRQRFAAMVNRYDVMLADESGRPGAPIAFAQQKRMALREQVTVYTDDSKSEVLCAFRARQMIDVRATYDVTAPDGTLLGSFRKEFGASLLRSTFVLEQPGQPPARGQERNMVVALVRRFVDLPVPLPVHFDFAVGDTPVMSVERAFSIRDTYDIHIPAPGLDRRLAIAMAIGLDALMSR